MLLSGADAVIGDTLVSPHIGTPGTRATGVVTAEVRPLREAVEALERDLIVAALDRSKGNKSEAARELGISRSNLIAKVQAFGLKADGEDA